MHTCTVLGGTGSTGVAVIKTLLQRDPNTIKIKIYARSQTKLDKLLPDLKSHTNIQIINGSFSDPATAIECLRNTDTIFSCLASNYSDPGMSLITDTANSIITALETIKNDESPNNNYTAPTILMLSTSSINPEKTHMQPYLEHIVVNTALYYLYTDLRNAESRYRTYNTTNPGLLDVIFVEPGGIMPGNIPTGYELSVTKMSSPLISYADLGASMVEMADRKDEFEWKGVSILATGKVDVNFGENAKCLVYGLFTYFLPGFWRVGRGRGVW